MEAISTERLVLREWRPSDREPFADMNGDSAVMEHFPSVMTRGESDALIQSFIAHWMEYGFGRYAVEVADSAVFIGFVGVMVPRFDAPFMPAVEIAWRLNRGAWGHGYATEAARAACRSAYEVNGVTDLVSITTTTNVRSMAVMRRLRMTHDPAEDFDHPLLPDWPNRRHVLYRGKAADMMRS